MRPWKFLLPLLASTLSFAQQPDRITSAIDAGQTVVLPGHINRNAKPQYDQGPVDAALQFDYVTLVIAPSPTQQAALDQLLVEQQDRTSPNYHKWLTPEQYADRFGLSQNDVNKITAWLQSQGLTVLSVPRGRNSVIFSGTASQVQSAFNTEIHRYDINGEKHIANSTPVSVPATLSSVITGIRGLTDFRPKPMYVRPARSSKAPGPHPSYTTTIQGNTDYFLAPGDIATIYDLNPLYNASTPINGAGQQLAVIGQTDVYLADLVDFRSGFGLPSFTCTTDPTTLLITSCDTTYFQYVLVGADEPVSVGDLFESDLDLEWSGAIAPNAQIIFVNAPINSAGTSGGVNVALAYAVENVIAPVISMSYGQCEAEAESLETDLQQANTEGITVMNSADDTGSAGCDFSPPGTSNSGVFPNNPYAAAEFGLAVSYPASSPEVTGVGGTSIPPIPAADYSSAYWGSTNGTTGGSALSTIEGLEAAWNDDAAFAEFCEANASNTFCTVGGSPAVSGWKAITSAETAQEDIWISIGGGGVSNCYNETGSGICTSGFPKPTWQQAITIPGLTSPQSTYRFVPDVSLLASPDFPGYILCTPQEEVVANSTSTSSSCASGISTAVDTYFSLVGGTSASTPIFAAVVTLLNQYLGSSGLGNINPTLYALAATPSNGAFHKIITGDNDVSCQAGTPSGQPADVICPSAGAVAGVNSIGFNASNADTTTGYNLVTGLGSVDANNLAIAWAASRTASSVTIASSATAVNFGTSVTFTATVTPSTGVGTVQFVNSNNGGAATVLGTATLNVLPSTTGTATFTTTQLPGGSDSVTAVYEGDASSSTSPPSSTPAVVNVTAPDFSLSTSSALSPVSIPAGQSAIATLTLTLVQGTSETINFTNSAGSSTSETPGSCTAGLPVGAFCTFNPTSVTLNGSTPVTVQLTITTTANMALPTGLQTITVTGTPSVSGATSHTTTVSLTVAPTNQSFTIASTNGTTFQVNAGGPASVSIAVTGAGSPINFVTNSTTALPLTYTCATTSLPSEAQCNFSPTSGNSVSQSTLTLNITTTPPTSQLRPPLGRGSRIFYALLLPGLFGIVFAGGSRTRRARLLGLIMVLGFSTLWLGSCSGGSNSSQNNPGTPAGTYSVVVNATTATPTGGTALTGTFTVSLTVTN